MVLRPFATAILAALVMGEAALFAEGPSGGNSDPFAKFETMNCQPIPSNAEIEKFAWRLCRYHQDPSHQSFNLRGMNASDLGRIRSYLQESLNNGCYRTIQIIFERKGQVCRMEAYNGANRAKFDRAIQASGLDARGALIGVNKDLLRESGAAETHWQLLADATLARGDCRLESERSRLDARVETRLAALIDAVLGDSTGSAE